MSLEQQIFLVDNLHGQMMEEFIKYLLNFCNTLLWLLPSGCTDEVQPIDVGYERLLKVQSGKRLDERVDVGQNLDEWASGKFPASGRRILLTHMMEQSIKIMNKITTRATRFSGSRGWQ